MSYSADLSPTQVWAMMEEYPDNVVVVDVRTQAEWSFVGLPETTPVMKPVVAQEWQMFPSMSVDPEFTAALANKLSRLSLDKDAKLCFLCRSGVRSMAAASAMSSEGYANTYNVAGGFEGDPDAHGHRGTQNGWKAEGLPWRQS